MLRHAPFLERARVERDHEREATARLALAAYVVVRLVDRMLDGVEGEDAVAAFSWQLEAVRRHLADLPGDLPETAHLAGIVDAVGPTGVPGPGLRLSLTAYAYFLEHEARLSEALDVLPLAGRTQGAPIPAGDFASLALFAGRLNRLLARWAEASRCYGAAEAAGRAASDPITSLRGRLGRGAVLRGQGNLPLARTMVEGVIAEAGALNLREVLTIAWADLGSVLANQGLKVESLQANYQAFQFADDSVQRMRVLGDIGIGLLELGAPEEARLAFEIVAGSNTSFLVRTNAMLELMELESGVGNRMAFERRRNEAQEVYDRMTPSMAADFHYKTGVGLLRFGKEARAREALDAGLRLAEMHRLNAWYFRFERVLATLGTGAPAGDREPEPTVSPARVESPAVREVAVGLREYALLST